MASSLPVGRTSLKAWMPPGRRVITINSRVGGAGRIDKGVEGDHLAGALRVTLFDALMRGGHLSNDLD